jgi:hypothetical protein
MRPKTRSPLLAALALVVVVVVVVAAAAACHEAPLPLPARPMEVAQCSIEPVEASPPDDPLLDLRLEVIQRCAYCNPVSVSVAEVFPLEPRGGAGRWLGTVTIDYGRETLDRCDVLRAGVGYPGLVVFVDVDEDGRCDPGVDRVRVDQRYTWGYRDEIVTVDLLDRDAVPLATAESCALLPPR